MNPTDEQRLDAATGVLRVDVLVSREEMARYGATTRVREAVRRAADEAAVAHGRVVTFRKTTRVTHVDAAVADLTSDVRLLVVPPAQATHQVWTGYWFTAPAEATRAAA